MWAVGAADVLCLYKCVCQPINSSQGLGKAAPGGDGSSRALPSTHHSSFPRCLSSLSTPAPKEGQPGAWCQAPKTEAGSGKLHSLGPWASAGRRSLRSRGPSFAGSSLEETSTLWPEHSWGEDGSHQFPSQRFTLLSRLEWEWMRCKGREGSAGRWESRAKAWQWDRDEHWSTESRRLGPRRQRGLEGQGERGVCSSWSP